MIKYFIIQKSTSIQIFFFTETFYANAHNKQLIIFFITDGIIYYLLYMILILYPFIVAIGYIKVNCT
jgi:hypothetical protein